MAYTSEGVAGTVRVVTPKLSFERRYSLLDTTIFTKDAVKC